MDQQKDDAVLRRILRERREAKECEVRLDTEAKHIAEAILRLGHALYHNPARIFFEGQAHAPDFLSSGLFRDSDYPNVEHIKRLTAELREVSEKHLRLGAQLEHLGCNAIHRVRRVRGASKRAIESF